MKTKVTMSFEPDPEDPANDSEMRCALNGAKLNYSIADALQAIRARLKYGPDVTETESDVLENIRTILSEYYIE